MPGPRRADRRPRALAILREDRAYLEALLRGPGLRELPLARRTGEQKRIHAENVERVRS